MLTLANLYGADVNPLAVFITSANIILNLVDLPVQVFPVHVLQCDFLFPDSISVDSSDFIDITTLMDPPMVDLLIGNPPWLVLNGIASQAYQRKVKELARELGIMMGGKTGYSRGN